MRKRVSIDVAGIVQGVGFRPYVFRLAQRLELSGFVRNNTKGVHIEIEGTAGTLQRFISSLRDQPPPLALITKISTKDIPPRRDTLFEIFTSDSGEQKQTLISPDIATCPDCLSELLNSSDRRYLYPFINCTNCGPRFTIIRDIPYDRPATSMAGFRMCSSCQAEYENPQNRRFHAQPNACPICGPRIFLVNRAGEQQKGDPLKTTVEMLKKGKIVAVKGIGGYHLAAEATADKTVKRLRSRKHRYEKPLAVMVPSVKIAREIAEINDDEEKLLQSLQRPIVLCRKKESSVISEYVSLDNSFYGIMLPYTPLHELFFMDGELKFLIMTSANISEEPIIKDDQECLERLQYVADYFLVHDRGIYTRCDDSVMRIAGTQQIFIRRSRGYAPRPIILNRSGDTILAVGGHKKNTICLTRDSFAFLSQHIGDLENLQTLENFEQSIDYLQRLFEIRADTVIHDLHPEYLSTKWAMESAIKKRYGVQHHYAHILSVMAEHGLEKDVIGFSMDGTGFGLDGNIWGGEILLCDINNFQRHAHFEYVQMPGGEYAVREPWRMGYSYLYQYCPEWKDFIFDKFPDGKKLSGTIDTMIGKKINSPLTSSLGRLFDGVASILGVRSHVTYEGQAAILLESLIGVRPGNALPDIGKFKIVEINGRLVISPQEIICGLVSGVKKGVNPSLLSLAFHVQIVNVLVRVAGMIRTEFGWDSVALSGGCFQNLFLLTEMEMRLRKNGFQVYTNHQVPANDGGISLGQAYWGMINQE